MKSSLLSVTTTKVLHFCDDFPSVKVVPQENEDKVFSYNVGKINTHVCIRKIPAQVFLLLFCRL